MVLFQVQLRVLDAEQACQVHEMNLDQEGTLFALGQGVFPFPVGVLLIALSQHAKLHAYAAQVLRFFVPLCNQPSWR